MCAYISFKFRLKSPPKKRGGGTRYIAWSGVYLYRLAYTSTLTCQLMMMLLQVDANSLGSVLPAFANYGLLSGMMGYFIHQLTAGTFFYSV